MSEQRRARVLVHRGRGGGGVDALLPDLRASTALEVEARESLAGLSGFDVALTAGGGLDAADAAALVAHLGAGGGVVALGCGLQELNRHPRFAELNAWSPGDLGPEAELVVRPVPGGPLGDRLDPEIRLRDRPEVGDPPPPDALPLLTVRWHHATQVVGFSRRLGAGRLVHIGLGHSPHTLAAPALGPLIRRALRLAAGLPSAPPVGVGLYGFGAIGREHAMAVAAVPGLELRGICDRAAERRTAAAAEFGVPVHAEASRLLADPATDLIVVGVPPALHEAAVLECLAAGRHVICEKPFCLRAAEADSMMEAAASAGKMLTVYQSRRWDPDFAALRAAVRAGSIGRLFYMESFIGGFSHPCDYWHSHEPISGGTIYDWGSHYFDWVLQLFEGEVAAVAASAHKLVWHDVTNADQVRVDLTFSDGRQALFLQSDIAAAAKPKWYLLGTGGAITGEWRLESVKSRAWTGDLVEEALAAAESPAVLTVHRPDGWGQAHREVLALPPRAGHGFYRNLADHLLLGEPLAVPPAQARRNVVVMEAAARSIATGGRPVEVRA